VRALSVLSAFLAAVAAGVWLSGGTARPGPGWEPVTPLPPGSPVEEPPDLPAEPLDPEDIACVNDLANDPEWPAEFRAEALRQLLTFYLRPPTRPASGRSSATRAGWPRRMSSGRGTTPG
jgi:hypothetical protein